MGIAGSGMSAVSQIAQAYGFEVSGCDLKSGGHSVDHLKNIDILAVTPAVFYQNSHHPEVEKAKKLGILMKWQEFMGKYLHQNKFVICIAGTHGKSTTTAWVGHLLEEAGLDPTVEIGAIDNAWKNNVRIGKSKYFVTEADEFHNNFSSYHPDVIILNNLEMDHPEYFTTLELLLKTYQDFINNLRPNGILIYNADSPLIHKLKLPKNSISYTLSEFKSEINLPGNHNKSNAMGVIKLAEYLKINFNESFTGVGRRIEFLGEKNGIKIYDDYANHPTAFAAVLQALKETYPSSRLWTIIEPHTFSRLRTLLPELPASLKLADKIIISKIFASRETDPGNFSGSDIAKAVNGQYVPEFSDITNLVKSQTQSGDIIIVMGSGNSNKLSRQILENL